VQSGQGIDLLRLPSDRLPGYVNDDLVEPIDSFLTDGDKADILSNVLDVVRLKDGKAYAWPLWVVPMGIYVNKDVFAEAKVALPPKDWTWDQFVDVAKKTTFKRANGEQVQAVHTRIKDYYALCEFLSERKARRPGQPSVTEACPRTG